MRAAITTSCLMLMFTLMATPSSVRPQREDASPSAQHHLLNHHHLFRLNHLNEGDPQQQPQQQQQHLNATGGEENDIETEALRRDAGEMKAEALRRLRELFGLERDDGPDDGWDMAAGSGSTPGPARPPQFMLDLYEAVAGEDGVTREPGLLAGNVVRSFLNRVDSDGAVFVFDVARVSRAERVLSAELHVFRQRTRRPHHHQQQHYCQVNVFALHGAPPGQGHTRSGRLVASRLVSLHGATWEVFTVTRAVQSWVSDRGSNHGLLVTADGLSRDGASERDAAPGLRFVDRSDPHDGRQPMLVVFSDDGRRSAFGRSPSHDYELPDDISPSSLRPLSRSRRTLPKPSSSSTSSASSSSSLDPSAIRAPPPKLSSEGPGPCRRHPMYVDFEEVGWSGWVISPRGYNAYSCGGACPFPLGHALRPTNHATVQSVVRALRPAAAASAAGRAAVRAPCCVPDELYSINLLYYDEAGNVVLKQYDDMVAASCGCH